MVKFYALDQSFIHDAEPTDGFVIDMVRASDYVELEKRIAELEKLFSQEQNKLIDSECHVADLEKQRDGLVAENAGLKEAMRKLDSWGGIEFYSSAWEFNNNDGYEAAVLLDIETPATDAAIAEIGAKAVELLIKNKKSEWLETYISDAQDFSQQLREGGV